MNKRGGLNNVSVKLNNLTCHLAYSRLFTGTF